MSNDAGNFQGHYADWRTKRFNFLIDTFGAAYFRGKTIYEFGAGHGDLGNMFQLLGANVTCLEGRPENIQEGRRKYPHLDFRQIDFNHADWHADLNPVDIVINFGLLYHLEHFEECLRYSCSLARDLMLLETEIMDSDQEATYTIIEDSALYDQSLNGKGTRPTARIIENIAFQCGTVPIMITNARLNSGVHRYDWPIQNTQVAFEGNRRFWIVKPHQSLAKLQQDFTALQQDFQSLTTAHKDSELGQLKLLDSIIPVIKGRLRSAYQESRSSGRKFAVWGIGGITVALDRTGVFEEVSVDYWIDSSAKNAGVKFHGTMVSAPDIIETVPCIDIFICTVSAVQAIEAEIRRLTFMADIRIIRPLN